MAKNFEMFERYNFIIEQLEKADLTATQLSEIFVKTKKTLVVEDKSVGKSAKTFKRDIEDLQDLFFQISYNAKNYKYSLHKQDKNSEKRIFFLKQLAFFGGVTKSKESAEYIDFERSSVVNDNYREDILKACQTKTVLHLKYYSYWHQETIDYEVAPYMLKLFRNRWYLIGKVTKNVSETIKENKNEGDITRFPLERIRQIVATDQKFELAEPFNSEDYYKDSFGIMEALQGSKVEQVELLFESVQGQYIKNLPLHHSQTEVENEDKTLLVHLNVHITYDFVQEILHFGETVKVIAPESLKAVVENVAIQMSSYYTENKDIARSYLY